MVIWTIPDFTKMVKEGFRGKRIRELHLPWEVQVILLDSAKIHEEEAWKANKEDYSSISPHCILHIKEAEAYVAFVLNPQDKDQWSFPIGTFASEYQFNGHIIGACFIELKSSEIFVFSGDIGRLKD